MKILIICIGNSCRSQMAEGFLKHYRKDWAVKSAGLSPTRLNPLAMTVMKEKEIDISNQKSKGLDDLLGKSFDYIITVYDNARESCPVFLSETKNIHWSFEDPARVTGSLEQKLVVFRKVRDKIEKKILKFLEESK